MSEDELNEAVEALIRWLQSQDLSIEDSALVCAKTICVAILQIAKINGDDSRKGARAIAQMIQDAIKDAGGRDRRPPKPPGRPF